MSLARALWRCLLLLLHALYGIWISLTIKRETTSNGEKLPDPEAISRWSQRLLEILHLRVITQGQRPHYSALIVANHFTWLDIPVISSHSHAAFLSKNSVRYWPIVGWFANASGTVFIRRGKGEAQQVAQAIAHRLRGDRQLAIFPEGRISGNSKVERFFPRLFSAAIDTGTPVVPVALRYIADGKIDQAVAYTPDRHFLAILFLLLMRRRSEVHLIYGEPIPPAGKDRRTLAEEARDAIQAALDSIAVD